MTHNTKPKEQEKICGTCAFKTSNSTTRHFCVEDGMEVLNNHACHHKPPQWRAKKGKEKEWHSIVRSVIKEQNFLMLFLGISQHD